jgi:pimeloyl-ACP methyl ester carboxylesterase
MEKQLQEKKLNYIIHNFKTEDKLTLTGILNKSNSKLNEKTIILHIHGMCSSLFSNIGQIIAETANKNKLSSFLINTRGHGIVSSFKQKKENGKSSYHTGGTAYEKFENSTLDINGAINYLKTLGYKKIILSGHSTGCQKITYFQTQTHNKIIKSLILLAPADDLNMEKRDNLNFNETLKLSKTHQKNNSLFQTEDFGLLCAKRFYELFKKTSIEGNLFNYTKNLEYLKEIKIPILSIIGTEDTGFLNVEKANTNLNNNFTHKKSYSKLIQGNHSFYKQENNLKKEIGLFLKLFK